MSELQPHLFDLSVDQAGNFSDEPIGIVETSETIPVDAIEVLRDGGFHSMMSSSSNLEISNFKPIIFWINGKAEKPLTNLEFPTSGPGYRLEFHRNQGSWGREGSDLTVKGVAVVGESRLPVSFIAMDNYAFVIAQQNPNAAHTR